jgi:hypothetical protein
MLVVEFALGGVTLLVTVAGGTVVHELSHAVALEAFGIPYDVRWLPRSGAGVRGIGLSGALASVEPRPTMRPGARRGLRVAAMMPLLMTAPLLLVLGGVVADPAATGGVVTTAVVVGWLACALPSPRDFAVCWNPEQAVRGHASDSRGGLLSESRLWRVDVDRQRRCERGDADRSD